MDKYKFVRSLRYYPLTRQQVKTLRGQALAGDVGGAVKGLRKCLSNNKARSTTMKIKIKNHTDNPLPKAMPGGDWIDLYCAEDVELQAGEYRLISLGISVELPEGYEAIVAPRSSTPARFGIICPNSIGVIDNAYCGDNDIWALPALAFRDTTIRKGDRIAQFRIQRNQPEVELVEVESLSNPDRGGLGSTGTR